MRLMFDSRYLGAWHLQGRDCTVTIAKITPGTIEGERGRKDKAPLIYFKGKEKPLVCNKTNMKSIKSLYGTLSAAALVGKQVTLYPTTTNRAGEVVDCIRIRPTKPSAGSADTAIDENLPVDEEMRTKQVTAASDGQ